MSEDRPKLARRMGCENGKILFRNPLVTKDSDFVTSFHLKRLPPKLLLVSPGNIDNETLIHLFIANIIHLQRAFAENDFVELSRTSLTLHE